MASGKRLARSFRVFQRYICPSRPVVARSFSGRYQFLHFHRKTGNSSDQITNPPSPKQCARQIEREGVISSQPHFHLPPACVCGPFRNWASRHRSFQSRFLKRTRNREKLSNDPIKALFRKEFIRRSLRVVRVRQTYFCRFAPVSIASIFYFEHAYNKIICTYVHMHTCIHTTLKKKN